MYAVLQRAVRGLAITALALSGMAAIAPPAQAAFWYPFGIQTNVAASTITGNSWTLCWSGTYADSANLSDVLAACDQSFIMLAGGVNGSSTYMLAGAGPRSTVFGTTASNTTSYANGVYFYYNAQSMGFAPNSTITQSSADTKDSTIDSWSDGRTTGAYRMSWHTSDTTINGGWRVGLADGLNSDTSYVRAIYESNGVAAPSITTQPSSQTKNVGDSVSFSVSASSPDGGSISYQWQRYTSGAWADISGATSSTYSIAAVALGDALSYRANVKNTLGGYSTTSPSNTVTLTVNRLTPTALTITSTAGTYGSNLTLTSSGGASNSSSTTYAVTTVGTAGCSITGTTLSFTASGSCGVTASKAADSTYAAVDSAETTITIAKAAQATLLVTPDTATYGVGITLATTGGSGSGAVTYTVTDGGSAGCAVTGNALSSIGAGTCAVSATKATDSRYLAATSAASTMTILSAGQSTLTISTTLGTYGSALTLGTTGGSGTGAVSYTISDSGTALCSIAGSVLTPGHAGTCTVVATKAADGAYLAKSSSITTITFAKAAQATLTITTTAGTYGSTLTLETSGGSGTGNLLFAVTDTGTAQCSVTGSTLSAAHGGTCQVTAVKVADGNYEATSDVRTITFAKAAQAALSITSTNGTFLETLTLTTSGGSGAGAVTYTLNSAGTANCALSSDVLTPGHAGTCTVTATKATDTDYLVESSTVTTITFAKAAQGTLTITSTNGTFLETLTLTTSGGSGSGLVTYVLDSAGTANCSLSNGILTPGHAGTCTVTATKATDTDYLVRSSSSTTITIAKAEQAALSVTNTSAIPGISLTLATTGGSGIGAVTFTVSSAGATGCSITAGLLDSTGPGTCTVYATKATDADYLAMQSASVGIIVSKLTQAALVVSSTDTTYLETLTLTTTGGSGTGAVTFAVTESGTAGCSITSGILHVTGAGSCSVTATKATDALYLERSSAATTITVAKAVQATLTAIGGGVTVLDPFALTTTGGSGSGSVRYIVVSGAHCTITGAELRGSRALPCSIVAIKATDSNYLEAQSAPVIISVGLREVVIYAPTVSTDLGSLVTLQATQLGLISGDALSAVEMRFEGTTIRGDHYGPSTVMPTQAGTYTVTIASFTLAARDADIYTVATRAGTFTLRWVALPVADPALAAVGSESESGDGNVVYTNTGAAISNGQWSLSVQGVAADLAGLRLVVAANGRLSVIGTGYQPFAAVRIFLMSRPAELGTAWTDANGAFTVSVTIPSALADGAHVLQVNGYAASGAVLSTAVAVQAVTSRSLSVRVGFRGTATTATTAAVRALVTAAHRVASSSTSVRIVVTATASRGSKASRVLASKRAIRCAKTLDAQLREHGIDVGFTTKIRTLKAANPRLLRTVLSTIRW